MRNLLTLGVVGLVLAAAGQAPATEKLPPATVAATGTGKTVTPPAADTSGQSCAACSPGCKTCKRQRCGLLQRLREWLTYRALPVPRECKCYCTCNTGCTPPLYSYFALRYPPNGHVDVAHDAAHAAPPPTSPPLQLPPLKGR